MQNKDQNAKECSAYNNQLQYVASNVFYEDIKPNEISEIIRKNLGDDTAAIDELVSKLIWIQQIINSLYQAENSIPFKKAITQDINEFEVLQYESYTIFQAKYEWAKYKLFQRNQQEPSIAQILPLISSPLMKSFDKNTSDDAFDNFLHFVVSKKDIFTYDQLINIINLWVQQERSLTEKNGDGATALHIAAQTCNNDAIKALADASKTSTNNTSSSLLPPISPDVNAYFSSPSSPNYNSWQPDQNDNDQPVGGYRGNDDMDIDDDTIIQQNTLDIGANIEDNNEYTPLDIILNKIWDSIAEKQVLTNSSAKKNIKIIEHEDSSDLSTLKVWVDNSLPIQEKQREFAEDNGLVISTNILGGNENHAQKNMKLLDDINQFLHNYSNYFDQQLQPKRIATDNKIALLLHYIAQNYETIDQDIVNEILTNSYYLGNNRSFNIAFNCEIEYEEFATLLTPIQYAEKNGHNDFVRVLYDKISQNYSGSDAMLPMKKMLKLVQIHKKEPDGLSSEESKLFTKFKKTKDNQPLSFAKMCENFGIDYPFEESLPTAETPLITADGPEDTTMDLN